MIWIGLAIVVVTFWLIYKNYEARLVLCLSGIVMALIGQYVCGSNVTLSTAVDAFIKQLVNGGLVPTIVTVMGFGYVMTFTKCSDLSQLSGKAVEIRTGDCYSRRSINYVGA